MRVDERVKMNVQDTVRNIQTQVWAQQVWECQQSGLTVRQWCEENGIGIKTYYYRRKRVREELLDSMESGNTKQLGEYSPMQLGTPVFAAIPMPQRDGTAVTVQIGSHVAEIHNGADPETVEGVLRTLTRL